MLAARCSLARSPHTCTPHSIQQGRPTHQHSSTLKFCHSPPLQMHCALWQTNGAPPNGPVRLPRPPPHTHPPTQRDPGGHRPPQGGASVALFFILFFIYFSTYHSQLITAHHYPLSLLLLLSLSLASSTTARGRFQPIWFVVCMYVEKKVNCAQLVVREHNRMCCG